MERTQRPRATKCCPPLHHTKKLHFVQWNKTKLWMKDVSYCKIWRSIEETPFIHRESPLQGCRWVTVISWIYSYVRRITMLSASFLGEILSEWQESQVKYLKRSNSTTALWPMPSPTKARYNRLVLFKTSKGLDFLRRAVLANFALWPVSSFRFRYEFYTLINRALWNSARPCDYRLGLTTLCHKQYEHDGHTSTVQHSGLKLCMVTGIWRLHSCD